MTRKYWQIIIGLAIVDFILLLALLFHYEVPTQTLPTVKVPHSSSLIPVDTSQALPIKSQIVQSVVLTDDWKLATGRSVKSVIFNPEKSILYSINLEGGNVYGFDRASRKISQRLIFKQTPAKGYDYIKHQWVNNSFAQKPVEGTFSHNGRFMWISWHNGDGIIAWDLQSPPKAPEKRATAKLQQENDTTEIGLHYFATGSTPKVMLVDEKSQRLYVSNWHGQSVSVLNIEGNDPEQWKVVQTVKVGGTPRGMCFSEDGKYLLVAQMALGKIVRISLPSMEIHDSKFVGNTPRHLLLQDGKVYVTHSSTDKLQVLSSDSLKMIQKVTTGQDPRTIAFSPDGRLIFVVCYEDHTLQVFRSRDLKLLATWPCKGAPVGVDVWQKGNKLEAWVGNYKYSTVKVFCIDMMLGEG